MCFRSTSGQMDHTVSAELIWRRWEQDRPDDTLNERTREVRLEASWGRRPGDSALELNWARRRGA
jgi:hypothetical protein